MHARMHGETDGEQDGRSVTQHWGKMGRASLNRGGLHSGAARGKQGAQQSMYSCMLFSRHNPVFHSPTLFVRRPSTPVQLPHTHAIGHMCS